MKLFYCPKCQDVVKLHDEKPRTCACGENRGRVASDGLTAYLSAGAIPLGFNNSSFLKALRLHHQQVAQGCQRDVSIEFTAFVIEPECSTVLYASSNVKSYCFIKWTETA
jgi:hypothetical protein